MRAPLYSSPRLYQFVVKKVFHRNGAFKKRFEAIVKELAESNCVLELGCGTGMFKEFLPKTTKYMGVEINGKFADYCEKKGIKIYNGDILKKSLWKPLSHKYFDSIVIVDVMHHIFPRHKQLVKNLPKGKKVIILDGIYKGSMWQRIDRHISRFLDNDGHNPYARTLTPREWEELKKNFHIEKIVMMPKNDLMMVGRVR
jgi:SAM-dependent methyltransferase